MNARQIAPWAVFSAAFSFGACGTSTDTVASQASALAGAQCAFHEFNAQADACFVTFQACRDVAGADLEACRAALKACLPAPPQGKGPGKGGCDADGGMGHGPLGEGGPHGPDGDHQGPPPDGGFGPGGPGGHRPHGGGKGGPGGAPRIQPDAAALTACHDALDACLAVTGADAKACFEAEHACNKAAFDAAFTAACASASAGCTGTQVPADACAKIAERCAQGIKGPGDLADGGVCQ